MVRNPVAVWMVCWVNGSSIVGGLGMRQSGETFMRSLSVAAGWSAIAWQCHAIGAVCTCAGYCTGGSSWWDRDHFQRSLTVGEYPAALPRYLSAMPATASLGPHANPCLVFSSPRHLVKVELNLYQPPIGESLGKIVTNHHLVKVSQLLGESQAHHHQLVKVATAPVWAPSERKSNWAAPHFDLTREWNDTAPESRINFCIFLLRVNFHEALKPWA